MTPQERETMIESYATELINNMSVKDIQTHMLHVLTLELQGYSDYTLQAEIERYHEIQSRKKALDYAIC